MGRLVVFLALVAMSSLWPASAWAATGQIDNNGVMVYTADPGESNAITFSFGKDQFNNDAYLVVDAPTVAITAVPPCQPGATQNQMSCPADGGGSQPPVTSLSASLGDGNDTITLLANLPTSIGAGGGADIMNGGPAVDFLRGGQGDDRINGGGGNDQIVGDDPNVATGGSDLVDGGTGDDSVDGQAGDDTVTGGDGNDQLQGGDGNDQMLADGGSDVIAGGPGIDLADYSARTEPQFLSLDGVQNDGQDTRTDNILTDVENLTGGSGPDELIGDDVANVLDGGPANDNESGGGANDTLIGGGGDDTQTGGDGADNASGGDGNDTLVGDAGDDALDGGTGNDALNGGTGNDSESGGSGADAVSGGDGADSLSGGADSDSLSGGADNDSLDGGADDDVLDGGTGADVFTGGDGVDLGDYRSRTSDVTVTLDGNAGDGEAGEGDNVQADVENVDGGSGADTFIGSASANALDGGGGEDYSDGGAGSDTLIGGDSGDVLRTRGSSEPDTIACGPGPDFVVAKATDTIAADCDRSDRGVNQKPKLRDSAVVTPSTGTLQMSPTGIVRRVPLLDKVVLPLRSIVDTVAGAAKVTSSASAKKSQTISLDSGAFDITQTTGKLPVTQFALQGGDFSVCSATARNGRASAAAAKKSNKTVRILWGNGKGNFRTKGKYASAAIRGTRWQTIDRCDGTQIRVTKGAVTVRDLVKKTNVVVKAGGSYLAKAR